MLINFLQNGSHIRLRLRFYISNSRFSSRVYNLLNILSIQRMSLPTFVREPISIVGVWISDTQMQPIIPQHVENQEEPLDL